MQKTFVILFFVSSSVFIHAEPEEVDSKATESKVTDDLKVFRGKFGGEQSAHLS